MRWQFKGQISVLVTFLSGFVLQALHVRDGLLSIFSIHPQFRSSLIFCFQPSCNPFTRYFCPLHYSRSVFKIFCCLAFFKLINTTPFMLSDFKTDFVSMAVQLWHNLRRTRVIPAAPWPGCPSIRLRSKIHQGREGLIVTVHNFTDWITPEDESVAYTPEQINEEPKHSS